MQQIEAATPAYLLVVFVESSWTITKNSNLTLMDCLGKYRAHNYDLAGMTWILPDRTEYLRGQQQRGKAICVAPVPLWK